MNPDHDLDRRLEAFLGSGPDRLADASFDAVRDHIDHTRQRAVIGPWRATVDMNKLVTYGLGAAAAIAVLFIGIQLLGAPAQGGVGTQASPSPTTLSGRVLFGLDGAQSTTEIDAVVVGTSVTGTAVTTGGDGVHTVALECTARDGETWALAGTIERTTIPTESAGHWSAVIIREGSPQRIGIWLSDDKVEGVDCDGWLGSIDLTGIGDENFSDVQSGELVAPPIPGS